MSIVTRPHRLEKEFLRNNQTVSALAVRTIVLAFVVNAFKNLDGISSGGIVVRVLKRTPCSLLGTTVQSFLTIIRGFYVPNISSK